MSRLKDIFAACSFSTVSRLFARSVIDGRSSGIFFLSFCVFLAVTNKSYVTTGHEKGFRLTSFFFSWPKTTSFVKLALYSTINCPPKGEVNSGEKWF